MGGRVNPQGLVLGGGRTQGLVLGGGGDVEGSLSLHLFGDSEKEKH